MYITNIQLPPSSRAVALPDFTATLVKHLPGGKPWHEGNAVWVPHQTTRQEVEEAVRQACTSMSLAGAPNFQMEDLFSV